MNVVRKKKIKKGLSAIEYAGRGWGSSRYGKLCSEEVLALLLGSLGRSGGRYGGGCWQKAATLQLATYARVRFWVHEGKFYCVSLFN